MDVSIRASQPGGFTTTWGESLRWDERRQRLYFVDCMAQTLHWLERGEPPLHTMPLPGLPTGVVLTEEDELVVCLDDGLHVVDADKAASTLLSRYPPAMQGRANDAHADGAGNLLTGTLNLTPGPGSLWWFGAGQDWRLLDDETGSTNGPQVIEGPHGSTLVVADTLAGVSYAYPYHATVGSVGPRRLFADFAPLGGVPDGATVDADGGIWACVVGAGRVARFSMDGELSLVVPMPVAHPSDVTFGGPDLDRLYVSSLAIELTPGVDPGPDAGRLLVLENVGVLGRPEPRFRLIGC